MKQPAKILLVDDDSVILKATRLALEAAGYEVRTASTGAEALSLAAASPPDLALLDRALPDMDGVEVCRRLKADPATAPVFVALISGVKTSGDDRAAGLETGADDYIVRPISNRELLARVQALLRIKQAEERIRYHADLLANVSDAVISTDLDFIIRTWNRAAESMYGWREAEVIGKKVSEVLRTEYPTDDRERVLQQFLTAGEWKGEVIQRRKDGTLVNILSSVSFIRDGAGNPTGVVAVNRDITERKHAEEQLRAAHAELQRLLAEADQTRRALLSLAEDQRAAEESLREGRQYLQAVLDAINDAVFVDDADTGEIIDVNRGMCEMYGYSREEALRTHIGDLSLGEPPYSQTEAMEWLRKTREVGPQTFEWLARHKDGHTFWVEVSTRFAVIGGHYRFVVIARDITERKQMEEKLRQSEETYRNLFHNAQVGLFRTRLQDGKVLESNEQLARMFGYDSREEFIAEYVTSQNYVDPGTRERMLELLRRDGFIQNFEARFFRKDRSIFWARYSARVYPEQGWIEGVAEDITAHKRAQDQLRASEERFRRAAQHAPYPAAIYAEDGEVVFVNAEWTRLTGYRREDIPTVKAWLDKAYGRRQKAALRLITSFFVAKEPKTTADTAIRCRDGTMRTWSFRSTPLGRDERGRRLVLSMAVDITERQMLEAQLRQAQKMEAIGRLAGGVAHDFNNLLQAMTMTVHAWRLRCPDAGTARAAAELEKHVKRGAELTRQLLLSSRRAQPHIERCDLNEVVCRAEALLRRLLPENIAIRTELDGGELVVEGDPAQLEQVLMNLAVNARDAMPEGGRLVLRTARHGEGEVCVEVEDSGVGMTREVRERIFEPFFTTKGVGQGTGLGLAVVHGIVAQHGGRVEVESEPGHGSVFRVALPRRLPGGKESLATGEKAAAGKGRGERVLVVEDEEGARRGLSEILTLLGYQATAVASAEEALALPEEPPFQILLSDLMLPGMTGGRLATALLARWPHLGVILMSGYPEDERVRQEVPPEARFLQKPFDGEALARALRATLDAPRS